MDKLETIDKVIAKYGDKLKPHYDGYTDQLYFDCDVFDYNITITIEEWFILRKVTLVIRNHDNVVTVVESVSGKEARRVIKTLMDIKKAYEDRLAAFTLSEII